VEILIVALLLLLMIGTLILLMTQFRKYFAKGEQTTEALQEVTVFLATLRKDLANATLNPSLQPPSATGSFLVGATQLAFPVYKDPAGNVEQVTYTIVGNSLQRVQGGRAPHTLIDGHLATLTWMLESDILMVGPTQGAQRLWLSIDLIAGGLGRQETAARPIRLITTIFPARLNRLSAF